MIEDVKRIAHQAGRAILEIYQSTDREVTVKSDRSPLTQADLRANEIIVSGLTKLTPHIPVISEEGGLDLSQMEAPKMFWLVDPLDGTRDFVARQETFVVCIALIEDGHPTLGVIQSPVTGELWWAQKSTGAFGPSGQKLFNRREGTTDLKATGSRSTPSDRMSALYQSFNVTHVDRFGSALKFCKVAEGGYDLYPRFGPTMEWDTAAGQIIAEEAGCEVMDLQTGLKLTYGKPGFANHGFICRRAGLAIFAVGTS